MSHHTYYNVTKLDVTVTFNYKSFQVTRTGHFQQKSFHSHVCYEVTTQITNNNTSYY